MSIDKCTTSLNNKIISIWNKNIPKVVDNTLYTQFNNTIYITDLDTYNIKNNITSESIINFDIKDIYLYYFNTEVYKYNLLNKSMHKYETKKKDILIKNINIVNDRDIIVIYEDNDIYLINDSEIFICNRNINNLIVIDNILYFSENNNLYSIDLSNKIYSTSDIKNIRSVNDNIIKLYSVNNDLIIITNTSVIINDYVVSLCIEKCDCIGNLLYLYGDTCNVLDCVSKKIVNDNNIKYNIIDNIKDTNINNNNIKDTSIINNIKDTNIINNSTDNVKSNLKDNYFRMIDKGVWYDNFYNIYQENTQKVVIGNIDEILDVKEINDMIIFTSTNKLIKIDKLNNKKPDILLKTDSINCCACEVIEHHSDTILSVSHNNKHLITTSKDSTSILYKINNNKLEFYKKHITGVMNTSCIKEDMCILVGDDGLLCKFNIFDDNILIQKVNDKDINSVSINYTKQLIFLGCSDKICKILDFNLDCIKILKDHKKSVMSVSTGQKYFSTGSSDKSIRIYNYNYECITVLNGHESGILFLSLFDNDKKLVTSSVGGLIKIWDINKGLCIDNIDLGNDVWSIDIIKEDIDDTNYSNLFYLLMGTTDTLVSYSTYKNNTGKNNTVYIKNKEYEKVITSNNKLIYFLLKESKGQLFDKYKFKLYDILIECGRFKDIEFINEIIKYCINKRIYDRNYIEDLKKYINMIDDLYGDLVGGESIFK